MKILTARHISIAIRKPSAVVYEYASNPLNLPCWASGLSSSVTKSGSSWVADSPMGKVRIEFCEPNPFGVIDHEVILETGQRFLNPLRVLSNWEGSEVVFTLFKQDTMSGEDFERDAALVKKDLEKLRELLEARVSFR